MFTIDYSQLQCYLNCPRKYKLKYKDCLRKIKYDERMVDADFGSGIHSALECYYKGGSEQEAKDVFKECFNGVESEKVKTPANGLKLLDIYFQSVRDNDSLIWDKNWTVLAVEPVDTFKINSNIDYLVKIDLVVKTNAGMFVVDHKTTKRMAYNFFEQFQLDMQFDGYSAYCEEKYGQCSGIIINALHIGNRERKYKDKPAGFWCEPTREIVSRTKEQLEEFRKDVYYWCDRLEKDIVFPRNKGSCNDYRGCTFSDLCLSCDDEQVRDTLYETYDSKEYLK